MRKDTKAATAGNGHGLKLDTGSSPHYPVDQAATQRATVLSYLTRHGSISTREARALLYIMHPAGRVCELRHQGHPIETVMELLRSTDGTEHRVARYRLRREG